ncbi:hypothetical protein JNUCC0626_18400 [Lentzea sp. JNUCC 0626]|uniref:hypothetical protein n=1 Tax=Lentzea sp. JNUCC 0626 TaxID=3367513 RepID=UPI003749A42A
MSTTFRRNQRVTIRQTEALADRRFVGMEGVYLGRSGMGNTGAYIVQVANPLGISPHVVRARTIEAVVTTNVSTPWAIHTSNATRTTKPAEAEGPVLIDVKRAQAAALAHQLLGGPEAHLDDLIGVAEFLLGEHKPVTRIADVADFAEVTRSASTSLQSAVQSAVQTLLDAAKPAPTMPNDEAREVVRSELNVDELAVRFDDTPDDDVVRFESYGTTYLKTSDVDKLIRYLQAAKVAHAAR